MRKFILCKRNDSQRSYWIKMINREVFSIEELSYCIYENIHLVNDDFIDEELCEFIKDKVDIDIRGKKLCDAVRLILESNEFYQKDDIEIAVNILENYKTGDRITRAKMIGDKYLINEDYNIAIKHYDSIINRLEAHGKYGEFLYSVEFNKGVALARKLEFKDAFLIFDKLSFTMDDSLEAMIYRYICLKYYDKKKYDEEYKYIAKDIKERLDNIEKNNEVSNLDYPMYNSRFMLIVDDVISNWKKQLCDDYIE